MSPCVVVPVNLGCCPHDATRCLLCPPAPTMPTPEYVSALIDHTIDQRGPEGVRVHFYGGPPPPPELLAAAADHPISVRVRPDLLSRADADRLHRSGVKRVELDGLTFSNRALKQIGRKHRRQLMIEILRTLREMGISPGIVLAPGLPGTDHEQCLADARIAVELADSARIHPVLVMDRAGLKLAHMDQRYTPLSMGAAITTCRAMLDILESGNVAVLRVGVQPGPDGLGRAVAGPYHPSFRQLVEGRRTLDNLRALLDQRLDIHQRGAHVAIICAPADETVARGPYNQHVRTLRAEYALASLRIRTDSHLDRGQFLAIEEPL